MRRNLSRADRGRSAAECLCSTLAPACRTCIQLERCVFFTFSAPKLRYQPSLRSRVRAAQRPSSVASRAEKHAHGSIGSFQAKFWVSIMSRAFFRLLGVDKSKRSRYTCHTNSRPLRSATLGPGPNSRRCSCEYAGATQVGV